MCIRDRLCVAWIYPIVMIFFNSLKTEQGFTAKLSFLYAAQAVRVLQMDADYGYWDRPTTPPLRCRKS